MLPLIQIFNITPGLNAVPNLPFLYSYEENKSPYLNPKFRFKTIYDVLNHNPICKFCNNDIIPCFRVLFNTNRYYSEAFHSILENSMKFKTHLTTPYKNKVSCYTSSYEDNILSLNYFSSYDRSTTQICSINVKNNINSGNLKEFSSHFLKNKVRISFSCFNQKCELSGYYFSTDKLYVDYKNNKLFDTIISNQTIYLRKNNYFYRLFTDSSNNQSNLLIKSYKPYINEMKQYPFIDVQKIATAEDIDNKIQTLLTFI